MRMGMLGLVLMFAAPMKLSAQRIAIKPQDFVPLTSLPWEDRDANSETVVRALYLEPDVAIRNSLLSHYLHTIPAGHIEIVFNLCLALEGTQTPDELVGLVLTVWGERDPHAAWVRTKELMRVVGVDDWLGLDAWDRPKITVQDEMALHESRFWLSSTSLGALPHAISRSSLPRNERVQLLREFADEWLKRFDFWPGDWSASPRESVAGHKVIEAFQKPAADLAGWLTQLREADDKLPFEIALRRRLASDPASAVDVIKAATVKNWPSGGCRLEPQSKGPSPALMMLWEKVDMPGMIRWADSPGETDDAPVLRARGMLMGRVEADMRQRWLDDAKKPTKNRQDGWGTIQLLSEWAKWEPKPAAHASVGFLDVDGIQTVVESAAYGPWDSLPPNTSHFGLGFVKDFDVASLIPKLGKDIVGEWGITIMELWGKVDVGEAARYGLDFMLRTDYAPRASLIKLFAGDDKYSSDSDMIDRTFCALRAWAVFKPDEMRAWIAKQKGSDLRNALTWLLDHPWGTGPEE